MIYTKQPEVNLITWTHEPVKAIALAVHAWTSDNFPDSLEEISDDEAQVLAKKALKAFHKTALEYVDTVWVIKNCSRAFQQQLTRTRLASFSIQSMRVVTKAGFATAGHYTMPPHLNDEQKEIFHQSMLRIEREYDELIASGAPVEDARSMLPLNIHSDISFRININALYHMLGQRLCVNTQWEYRQVAAQIKREVQKKLDPMLSEVIDAPCVRIKKCPMRDEYCGIPVWRNTEEEKMDIYNKYVSFKKVDNKWDIKWLNDDKPNFIQMNNLAVEIE